MTYRSSRRPNEPISRMKTQTWHRILTHYAIGLLVNLLAHRLGANGESDPPQLLVQDNGKAHSERLYTEHLQSWLNEQGWTDISFPRLRYSAAGTLNEAGANVAAIVSVIAHSTYQMALK